MKIMGYVRELKFKVGGITSTKTTTARKEYHTKTQWWRMLTWYEEAQPLFIIKDVFRGKSIKTVSLEYVSTNGYHKVKIYPSGKIKVDYTQQDLYNDDIDTSKKISKLKILNHRLGVSTDFTLYCGGNNSGHITIPSDGLILSNLIKFNLSNDEDILKLATDTYMDYITVTMGYLSDIPIMTEATEIEAQAKEIYGKSFNEFIKSKHKLIMSICKIWFDEFNESIKNHYSYPMIKFNMENMGLSADLIYGSDKDDDPRGELHEYPMFYSV